MGNMSLVLGLHGETDLSVWEWLLLASASLGKRGELTTMVGELGALWFGPGALTVTAGSSTYDSS